jgi:hypothetical protein
MYVSEKAFERQWLDYSADFNNFSHWVGHSANAFGDPESAVAGDGSFAIGRGAKELHHRWRSQRQLSRGYTNSKHPFRYQVGRLFTYKLFLEQCYALLRDGGRLGQIVPSGIYSDAWSKSLRELFLDHCRWEWLFGFENRDGIFEIHRSFKFNPIIIEKGGTTAAIRTAFMRRKLEDWERAEALATPYTRSQVDRFSPRSKAILEIQSARDLQILEKIYSHSVLLGDDGPEGWLIKYKIEFMMNTDAHLFPPRPKWEEEGYRPDEYSRWLKGDWRPIAELWHKLGIDPSRVVPLDPACAARLDIPDVQRTDSRLRCAQPPYDTLPIPRADIPAGIILSREAEIQATALPLYEGRMIGQFDFSKKGWVSGKGRTAVWHEIGWESKVIEPQYLMDRTDLADSGKGCFGPKIAYMRISSSTNSRTTISAYLRDVPAGDSVFFFVPIYNPTPTACIISGLLSSIIFDVVLRQRLSGLNMSEFIMTEAPLPIEDHFIAPQAARLVVSLSMSDKFFSQEWLSIAEPELKCSSWKSLWSITHIRRSEKITMFDALVSKWYGIMFPDLHESLSDCDWELGKTSDAFNPKGFWRVDKEKDPELRHTVLTLIAFHDLEEKIRACGGDRDKGIEAFLNQNNGEGWMLPETLRLADYGLGHDERAKEHQPVAGRLGPRFYDWQLAQSAEESWKECHLHARNLLGENRYRQLLADIEAEKRGEKPTHASEPSVSLGQSDKQGKLFE